MSTTLDRDGALSFATPEQDKPSLVLEMKMGMVDRGAPVKFASQYPSEEEILFAPLTVLEVHGTPRVDAGCIIVELRLNCNLHDLTIEQLTAKMQKTHLDLCHTIRMDMEMLGFSEKSVTPLLLHEAEYAAKPGEWFNNADHYSTATTDALHAKLRVCSGSAEVESASASGGT